MKIENAQVRVVKSEHATEVFVTSADPYINFKFNLPPDAEMKSGDGLEFVHTNVDEPIV